MAHEVDVDQAAPDRTRTIARGRRDLWRIGEPALVVLLVGLTFAVHDVAYALSRPYWTDEAWVAASTRYPFADLRTLTASTPIGWSALMRVFVVGGPQRQRIEPLLFAALAVAAAYWIGRNLGWTRRPVAVAAGVICGFATLTVPAMLVRDDLKQYTADAAAALLILGLTLRLDRTWSRRRLVELGIAIPVAMLFSHAAVVVGVASLGSLVVVQLVTRQWARLREAVVAAAATALVMFGLYELFDTRGQTPALVNYWRAYYVPVHKGFGASISMIRAHFHAFEHYLGLGPSWVVVALFAAGVVTVALARRFILALTLLVLGPELVVLSAAKKYPLLDLRTSTFVAAIIAVTVAIGVCGVCALVLRRSAIAAGALALAAVAGSLSQTHSFIRAHPIPNEDVRSQAAYLAAQQNAGDIIVVNYASNWGFAYYWKKDAPSWKHNYALWQVIYPHAPIVVAADRSTSAIGAAVQQSLALHRADPGSRIWLVLSHVNKDEKKMWANALRAGGVSATRVGNAGLELVRFPDR